jgi:transcriptional regulator with GAF, ATPase, and Fis domain
VSSIVSISAWVAAAYTVPPRKVKVPPSRAESEVSELLPAAPDAEPVERLDRLLHRFADRALQDTSASSVAIGLMGESAVICRTVAGLPLMEVGSPINSESGLTGMAIRRQMSQWCNDTESDARVDLEVCRLLGLRSIIVAPVLSRDTVVGVFAIFSMNPDAFSLADLNTVKKLAHWAAEAVETTAGNAARQVGPDREQLVSVHSERAHAAGVKNYVVKIQRGIVVKLNGLVRILRSRSV